MKKGISDFGISRVIEPKNAVPVTAWKIDNSKSISENECLIELDIIHLDRDSFQQICNSSDFDEKIMKKKIFDIINKRGKMHNPYTGTGGVCYGEISKMGEKFKSVRNLNIGDKVLSLGTLTGLPMHIEEIEKIDYDYGELYVKGYIIVFEKALLYQIDNNMEINYTLAAMDEAGSLYNIHELLTEEKDDNNILLIAKDIISAVLYMKVVKNALSKDCKLTVVLDIEAFSGLSEKQVHIILGDMCDNLFILDIVEPLKAFEFISSQIQEPFDFVINSEDLSGSETLSILSIKSRGKIYLTSAKNNYYLANFIAESMGKEVVLYAFDLYYVEYSNFTLKLLSEVTEKLNRVNNFLKDVKSSMHIHKHLDDFKYNNIGKIGDFVYASKSMGILVNEILNIAKYDCNLIIQGETGVGKEVVLDLIYKNSSRKSQKCIKINCATIQESLAESEFFGYEEGSFTGAKSGGKKGYFELANGGTLFLDEIGQLSLGLQSKLLRVLQENAFFRVGGNKPISINTRVICANNVPLKKLVDEGKFRNDLYYRLNIATIDIPPLRERIDDIPVMTKKFIEKYSEKYNVVKDIEPEAINRLMMHNWPGNVRELENFIHRLIIFTNDELITRSDVERILLENGNENIVFDINSDIKQNENLDFNAIMADQEKTLIEYGLNKCGSTRKAATYLNMTQGQLMRKKQKYKL